MSTRARQPRGRPIGGQFANENRASAALTLTTPEAAGEPTPWTPAPKQPAEGYMGKPGWRGGRCAPGYRPMAEVARDVRADVAEAVRGGYLPKGLTYSVRVNPAGSGIQLEARGMPWGQQLQRVQDRYDGRFRLGPTPHAQRVVARLLEIADQYSFDQGNSQYDYFHHGPYSTASVETPEEEAWRLVEVARRRVHGAGGSGEDRARLEESHQRARKEYLVQREVANRGAEVARQGQHPDWTALTEQVRAEQGRPASPISGPGAAS